MYATEKDVEEFMDLLLDHVKAVQGVVQSAWLTLLAKNCADMIINARCHYVVALSITIAAQNMARFLRENLRGDDVTGGILLERYVRIVGAVKARAVPKGVDVYACVVLPWLSDKGNTAFYDRWTRAMIDE